MTVTTTACESPVYTPDGVADTFPLTFKAFLPAELNVYRVVGGVLIPVTTGFQVTGLPDAGSVVFDSPPVASDGDLQVYNYPAFVQELEFANEGKFLAESVEQGFDRSVLRDQYLLCRIERLIIGAQSTAVPGIQPLFLEVLDADAPLGGQWMGGYHFRYGMSFPAALSNSGGSVLNLPDADTVWSLRKNAVVEDNTSGVEVATLTWHADGSDPTFATTDALHGFVVAQGDNLDWFANSTATTGHGWKWTIIGYVDVSGSGALIDVVTHGDLDAAVAAAIAAALPAAVDAAVAARPSNEALMSMKFWLDTTEPAGWKFPNGQLLSRIDFADFFAKVGTEFGIGDGVTTFAMPDWRGAFFRMFNSQMSAGVDPGRTYLVSQADAFQGHRFQITLNSNPDNAGVLGLEHEDSGANTVLIPTGDAITDGTNGTPRTAKETRPYNVNPNVIIKVMA